MKYENQKNFQNLRKKRLKTGQKNVFTNEFKKNNCKRTPDSK
jgi:hypothetical protein